jgi:hypothetical protein
MLVPVKYERYEEAADATVERAESDMYFGQFTVDSGSSVKSYPLAFKLNDEGVYIQDFPSPLTGELITFTDPQKIFTFGLRPGEKWESRSAYKEVVRTSGITSGYYNYKLTFSGKKSVFTPEGEVSAFRVDAAFVVSTIQFTYTYTGSIQVDFGAGPCFLKGWKYKNNVVSTHDRSELTLVEAFQGDSGINQLGYDAKSVVEWYANESTPNF